MTKVLVIAGVWALFILLALSYKPVMFILFVVCCIISITVALDKNTTANK
jgi:hypothetical protein